MLLSSWLRLRGTLAGGAARAAMRYAAVLLAVGSIGAGTWYTRVVLWRDAHGIRQPDDAAGQHAGIEGLGSAGPFYPSSVRTPDGHTIKSSFFMDSQACERCHADIYHQWFGSAHHFSSFNNQWYRKSMATYVQDVASARGRRSGAAAATTRRCCSAA